MKRVSTIVLSVVFACVISGVVRAEERPYLRAKIPFAFDVGKVHLPAGSYRLALVLPYNDVIELRNESTLQRVVVRAFPSGPVDQPKQTSLTFVEAGGRYFLSQIWESRSYREIRLSREATEMAREQARVTSVAASAAGR